MAACRGTAYRCGDPSGNLDVTSDPARPDGADAPPRIPILVLETADGLSHLRRTDLQGLAERSLGGQAAPLWMRAIEAKPARVVFNVLPVGWIGEWHETPYPQWVVPLVGRWFIETADGIRIEMGPGDIHWGQDQGTAQGRGHRSGQIGSEPCALLFVQYATAPADIVEALASDLP
jgi:hypothetical protein